jgi:hydrogenase large subunit
MSWDPITRIVGNLGIYTKIDFDNREVVECKSTSSVFRGYSVFMKGKDPRDAHFITSRICGICGDNHAVCSVYAQNMAYGIEMPPLADWIFNLGEAAEFMFDHTIFQDNLVFVDYCEQMVRETNPSLLERAEQTPAPNAEIHGYSTIADIMRAFNPFTGEVYKEALQVSRVTREMFCLMEGRHVHPSTVYPGGTGTMATVQVFTDYLSRLIKCLDFIKKAVGMNDDVFDFFYEALPGYEEVGNRRIMLGCWSAFQNPDKCDYTYQNMAEWGREAYVTPGIVVDGEQITTSLVDINLGIRILLGHSYYDDWQNEETFVTPRPPGQPGGQAAPMESNHDPQAAEARPQRRELQLGHEPALVRQAHRGLPGARYRRRADSSALGHGARRAGGRRLRQVHRQQRRDLPAQDGGRARDAVRVEDTAVVQHHRADQGTDIFPGLLGGVRGLLRGEGARRRARRRDPDLPGVRGARRGDWLRLPRGGARGLSHHMVIRDGKIANYHPIRPPVERVSYRLVRYPRPVRGRGDGAADLRGEWPRRL